MYSLKTLGLAAAIGLSPACEKPAEPPKQQEVVSAACERFRTAVGMEVAIEQMASHPAARKLFPAPLAEAAWKDVHAEAMAAAGQIEDQTAYLNAIKEGK